MAIQKPPMIIGNWKMNPLTSEEATVLAKAVVAGLKKVTDVTVGITPPLLFTAEMAKLMKKSDVRLGVQHVHPGPIGAFTGDVSPAMCTPFGVSYALVGHSERRARGMTDADVNAALLMLLKQKMTPILCIGEKLRDSQAHFYSEIETQITLALASVPAARYKDVVIAYEPIWAIGTGATATPADVQEMKLFIQKVLTKLGGRAGAAAVTILYGGSVTADSAAVLYREGDVHGFLVGGASLKAPEFLNIIKNVLTVK
jgi:triosephosphate isomerase (TIM)